MEKKLLNLVLPDGILDSFELEAIEKGIGYNDKPYVYIYLTEKYQIPKGYDPDEYECTDIQKAGTLMDFPIRGQFVYLTIRKRIWSNKKDPGHTISNDFSHLFEGKKMTRDLSAYLQRKSWKPKLNL